MTDEQKNHVAEIARERILQTDIALLNDYNVSDPVMSLLAAEHAARCEALAKAISPTLGRALLVMISGALLSAAKQIESVSYMVPELTHA